MFHKSSAHAAGAGEVPAWLGGGHCTSWPLCVSVLSRCQGQL